MGALPDYLVNALLYLLTNGAMFSLDAIPLVLALITVPAIKQKDVRQKNKICHFSVLHLSVWRRRFSSS